MERNNILIKLMFNFKPKRNGSFNLTVGLKSAQQVVEISTRKNDRIERCRKKSG